MWSAGGNRSDRGPVSGIAPRNGGLRTGSGRQALVPRVPDDYVETMDSDPINPTKPDAQRRPPAAATSDLPLQDVDLADAVVDEDDDERLPDIIDESGDVAAEGPLAIGRAAIAQAVRVAPTLPGVYRMLNAAHDVLYVGKAKNVRKRLSSYVRPTGHPLRIARMIAATVSVEIVSTATETEALLLDANLIK